jgi:hypothetical protein
MSLLAQIEGTTILFLAGVALTSAVLLFRTQRQLSSRPKTEMPSPASFSQPRPQAAPAHRLDAPRDMQQWEVEMHDLARELQAQLDSKIAILEHLIRDATQQADRLEAAIDRAEKLGVPNGQPKLDLSAIESGKKALSRIDVATARPGSSASRRHAEIYSLADQGLTSAAIATRLGSPIGEVDLILGLRENA